MTECLLHMERKIKEQNNFVPSFEKVRTSHLKKSTESYHCGKIGHIKHICRTLSSENQKSRNHHGKPKTHKVTISEWSSDSENDALLVS